MNPRRLVLQSPLRAAELHVSVSVAHLWLPTSDTNVSAVNSWCLPKLNRVLSETAAAHHCSTPSELSVAARTNTCWSRSSRLCGVVKWRVGIGCQVAPTIRSKSSCESFALIFLSLKHHIFRPSGTTRSRGSVAMTAHRLPSSPRCGTMCGRRLPSSSMTTQTTASAPGFLWWSRLILRLASSNKTIWVPDLRSLRAGPPAVASNTLLRGFIVLLQACL
jgi:hypothetical protein